MSQDSLSKINRDTVKEVELIGRIKFAHKDGFSVYCSEANRTFRCECSYFCIVKEDDLIIARCIIKSDSLLQIVRPPFVQPPSDKDSLVKCLNQVFYGTDVGNVKIQKLFSKLKGLGELELALGNTENKENAEVKEKTENKENTESTEVKEKTEVNIKVKDNIEKKKKSDELLVIDHLSQLASEWNFNKDPSLLDVFDPILKPEQTRKLLSWWYKNRCLRKLWLLGLNNKEIAASHLSCDELYRKCLNNPFAVPCISQEKCLEILIRINKKVTMEHIECGSVVRKMHDLLINRGWTGVPSNMLIKQFPKVISNMKLLKEEYGVQAKYHTVYLQYPYLVEHYISQFIIDRLEKDPVNDQTTPMDSEFRKRVIFTGRKELSEDQKTAVQGALDHFISFVNGRAGTGKTSVIEEICYNLDLRGENYLIGAPTGKAASRIKEVCKRNSYTIHKIITMLLGFKVAGDKLSEKRTPVKYVILDEGSMIAEDLFYRLLIALKKWQTETPKIIIFGDTAQLCPIEWGSLMNECLKSKVIPTYTLTVVHRMGDPSDPKKICGILYNANELLNFDPEEAKYTDDRDTSDPNFGKFRFVSSSNFRLVPGSIEKVSELITIFFSQEIPTTSIAIITPYNSDVQTINNMFQFIYNNEKKTVTDLKGKKWCLDDQVMCTSNFHDKGIYNGNCGTIIDISIKSILVDFGFLGKHEFILPTVESEKILQEKLAKNKGFKKGSALDDDIFLDDDDDIEFSTKHLTHSFCLSIHKSQGWETDFVGIYLGKRFDSDKSSFLNQNLVYTALTRARKAVWIIGDVNSLCIAATKKQAYRCENLNLRLSEKLKPFQGASSVKCNVPKVYEDPDADPDGPPQDFD